MFVRVGCGLAVGGSTCLRGLVCVVSGAVTTVFARCFVAVGAVALREGDARTVEFAHSVVWDFDAELRGGSMCTSESLSVVLY